MVLYTLSMLSTLTTTVCAAASVSGVSVLPVNDTRRAVNLRSCAVCVGVCVYIDKLVVNNRPRVCFYLFSCSPQVCALDSIRSVPAAVLTNFGRAVGLRTTLVDP